jgi:hypothetical protein
MYILFKNISSPVDVLIFECEFVVNSGLVSFIVNSGLVGFVVNSGLVSFVVNSGLMSFVVNSGFQYQIQHSHCLLSHLGEKNYEF